MAKIFSQLEKAQLENTTSDTASHPKGMITYRTDINQAKVSNGTNYKLLIDEDSTQTLSNKTYASPITSGAITAAQTTTPANPSSGSNKLYFKADGKLYTLDSSGNEAMVGSGTGGVKNLITNGNADDTSSSIFVPYADSGTRPTDGTGGSPTVTTSVTTSSPLDGTKSYLLTKPASNVQGQGWAVPFSVDLAYRAKSLKISADFIVNSGTFVAGSNGSSPTDGDVIWYIYDVTNSQLIEPSNIKMFSNSSSLSDKFEATFQSSATGSSYRLIAHVASTSALAFELKVDNVTVSPQTYVYGTPVTDWVSFTPTGSWSTNTTYSGFWRRVGDSIEVAYNLLLSGAPTAAPLTVNLPTGLSIDVSKIAGGVNGSVVFPSGGIARDNGSIDYPIRAGFNSITSLAVYVANSSSTYDSNNQVSNTVPVTFGSPDNIWVSVTNIPILGWSSSVQMSDGFDGREVGASYSLSTNPSIPNSTWTTLSFDSKSYDKTNSFSAGVFTVPSFGTYDIFASAAFVGNTAGERDIRILKNGSPLKTLGYTGTPGSPPVRVDGGFSDEFKAGDTISIQVFQNSGGALSLIDGVSSNYCTINKRQSPQAISATENIVATYRSTAGQAFNSTESVANFSTKVEDTHNAVTNAGSDFTFTAPANGIYETEVIMTGGTAQANADFWGVIHYNGVEVCKDYDYTQSTNHVAKVRPFAKQRLLAGQTIKIRARAGSSVSLSTTGSENMVCISRVGL